MSNTEKKQSVTLEELLQVKRHEKPDPEFWNSFENNFERRRLNALVERKSIFESLWSPTIKALAFSGPALLLFGLSAYWLQNHDALQESRLPSPSPLKVSDVNLAESSLKEQISPAIAPRDIEQLATSQFVVDAIEQSGSHPMNFRKVLYTPAIRLSIPNGSSYVKDNMQSRNYGVTTADVKLGRNF